MRFALAVRVSGWVGGAGMAVLQKTWHLEVRAVGSWPAAPELRCWISWEMGEQILKEKERKNVCAVFVLMPLFSVDHAVYFLTFTICFTPKYIYFFKVQQQKRRIFLEGKEKIFTAMNVI